MDWPKWMDEPFAKAVMAKDSWYDLKAYYDGEWHNLHYTGWNDRGMWFVENGAELFMDGDFIISHSTEFKWEIPDIPDKIYERRE